MDQIWESLQVVFIPPFKDGKMNTYAFLMWCIFFAVLLVFIAVRRQNTTVCRLIRALRAKEATTEDTAVSLKELSIKTAPKTTGPLFGKVEKNGTTLYYLPEAYEKKASAYLKAGSTPLWLAILEMAGLYVGLVALYYFLTWYYS